MDQRQADAVPGGVSRHHERSRLKADAAGLAVLAGLSTLPLWFTSQFGQALVVWLFGFALLAALAIMAWRSERWPAGPLGALKLAALSAAAGGLVFSLTAALVMVFAGAAEPSFVQAGLRGGVGLAIALALCPCLCVIALAGAVRNAVHAKV